MENFELCKTLKKNLEDLIEFFEKAIFNEEEYKYAADKIFGDKIKGKELTESQKKELNVIWDVLQARAFVNNMIKKMNTYKEKLDDINL